MAVKIPSSSSEGNFAKKALRSKKWEAEEKVKPSPKYIMPHPKPWSWPPDWPIATREMVEAGMKPEEFSPYNSPESYTALRRSLTVGELSRLLKARGKEVLEAEKRNAGRAEMFLNVREVISAPNLSTAAEEEKREEPAAVDVGVRGAEFKIFEAVAHSDSSENEWSPRSDDVAMSESELSPRSSSGSVEVKQGVELSLSEVFMKSASRKQSRSSGRGEADGKVKGAGSFREKSRQMFSQALKLRGR